MSNALILLSKIALKLKQIICCPTQYQILLVRIRDFFTALLTGLVKMILLIVHLRVTVLLKDQLNALIIHVEHRL